MKRATRILAVIGVIGVTMAAKHSLKQKLAERGNTLAQAQALTEVEGQFGSGSCTSCCNSCGSTPRCPVLSNNCDEELIPEDCFCEPGAFLNEPPLGGGGFQPTSLKTVLSSNQEQVFEETPDNSFTAFDESTCCSCENALHQAASNATKVRKFGIHGDICVTERIQYEENGCAEEASAGRARKNSRHTEVTGGGLGGGEQNCTDFTLTVCAPANITQHEG